MSQSSTTYRGHTITQATPGSIRITHPNLPATSIRVDDAQKTLWGIDRAHRANLSIAGALGLPLGALVFTLLPLFGIPDAIYTAAGQPAHASLALFAMTALATLIIATGVTSLMYYLNSLRPTAATNHIFRVAESSMRRAGDYLISANKHNTVVTARRTDRNDRTVATHWVVDAPADEFVTSLARIPRLRVVQSLVFGVMVVLVSLILTAILYIAVEYDSGAPLSLGFGPVAIALGSSALIAVLCYCADDVDDHFLDRFIRKRTTCAHLNHPAEDVNDTVARHVRPGVDVYQIITAGDDQLPAVLEDLARSYNAKRTLTPSTTPRGPKFLSSLASRLFGRETPETAAAREREEQAAITQRELEIERLRLDHEAAQGDRRAQQLRQAQRDWEHAVDLHAETATAYLDSQLSMETLLQRPAMTDITVDTTAAMIEAHALLEGTDSTAPDWLYPDSENTDTPTTPVVLDVSEEIYFRRVMDFHRAYKAADSYARRVRTSLVPKQERRTLKKIARLLERAEHAGTPTPERQLAYSQAIEMLGTLRHVHVPEKFTTELEHRAQRELTA